MKIGFSLTRYHVSTDKNLSNFHVVVDIAPFQTKKEKKKKHREFPKDLVCHGEWPILVNIRNTSKYPQKNDIKLCDFLRFPMDT